MVKEIFSQCLKQFTLISKPSLNPSYVRYNSALIGQKSQSIVIGLLLTAGIRN